MTKGTVFRDDQVWQGHPDVALFNGRIYVVYRQADKHLTDGETKIQIISTSPFTSNTKCCPPEFTHPETLIESEGRLNCPRLSVVDGELWAIVDEIEAGGQFLRAESDESKTRVRLFQLTGHRHTWNEVDCNITGIVPDRICKTPDGNYLIATHTEEVFGSSGFHAYDRKGNKPVAPAMLVQNVWKTDDLKSNQWVKHPLAHSVRHHLCEASIFRKKDKLICLIRENSAKGIPAFACTSKDGEKWSIPEKTRMFACHRPVGGVLKSGKVLVTYREASHSFQPGFWAKNTFACLVHTDKGHRLPHTGIWTKSPYEDWHNGIVLPLDHDASQRSDSGYTGWVQLPDKSIFIVNYIADDAPKPYIRWYRLFEEEF